ncbi:TPA: hypothetical protein ACH3X3_006063 [Trebouxia sp. C0006]
MNERDFRDQMANTNGLSNEQLLSELEKRAADAEKRLNVLESGNEGSRTGASPDVIQVLQSVKQLLVKAKDRQIELEKSEAQLTKSAKQTKTAVDTLQAKNSKLEYQILHLKRAVKDADAAKSSPN